jgi:two-component system cell cycle sensor histidine kinase/response regulator CckA
MSIPLHVLIVEDSEDDMALLVRELRRGGYDPTFERVDAPAGMSAALGKNQWDLIICDYSMPHFLGTDALRLLRATGSEVPFIFLSGTIGEETAIAALKQGAQDYVMKDNLKRLLPAIQRELDEAERRRERKRLEHQVQELQTFEAIGRLAGGIAHDFNNALGVILGWAQLGYDNVPDDSPVRENFRMIRDQAHRSAGLTRQLLAFARRQVLQPRSVNLNDLVSRMLGLLKTAVGEQTELKIALAPGLQSTMADPTQIDQVLMNLCLNARDAMPQGGRIVIDTSNVEMGEDFCRTHSYGNPGRYVLLSVSDTGIGMDAATLDRIFEPFFTTKEIGKGTGLGLATVYGIVKQHGGFVNVYSEPGQGTTFRVYLRASSSSPEAIEPATGEDDQKGGTETILVAEDHEGLREVVRQTLTSLGYSVILARDGRDAVRMFKANSEEIQLVVLDVVMPFLGGAEAHSQMCAIRPGLPVIFMSGYVAESVSLNSRITAGAAFLQKPCTPQALSRTIRSTLDAKNSA